MRYRGINRELMQSSNGTAEFMSASILRIPDIYMG
jgi:hypothetical protein